MKIYLICNLKLKDLPPALSIIRCLKDQGHELTLISPGAQDEYEQMFQSENIQTHYLYSQNDWEKICAGNILKRNKIMYIDWNRFVFRILNKIDKERDLVWILHEESAAKLSTDIFKEKFDYILSVYELRKDVTLLGKLPSNYIPIAQHAKLVISPEYNRSNILAAWLHLKYIPMVIPNKPHVQAIDHYDQSEIEKRKVLLKEKLGDKKMILYQGAFGTDRNLRPFIEAVRAFDDMKVVLMGAKSAYLEELLAEYGDEIIYLPGLSAPMHLEITKLAYIGIVSYKLDYQSAFDLLNVVYCAPNKIYEYSRFSVPMICTQQPGLYYTVETKQAGICVDCENTEAIQEALRTIDRNHEEYKIGSEQLYNSVNIPELVAKAVKIVGGKEIDGKNI